MVSEVDSDSDEEISTNRNKENSQRATIVWRLPSGEDNFKDRHGLDFSFFWMVLLLIYRRYLISQLRKAQISRDLDLAIWQVNRDKFFENFSRGDLGNKQISNNVIKLLSPWSAMSDLSLAVTCPLSMPHTSKGTCTFLVLILMTIINKEWATDCLPCRPGCVILIYIITKSMRALWLVNKLWVIVPVNPRKNRASSELLYKSNKPQVSMGYRLINHLGCW